jgi:hypothetical protein
MARVFFGLALGVGLVLLAPMMSSARDGLGVRIGLSRSPNEVVVGVQGEVGPALGSAFFTPSLDLGLGGDATTTVINADLRWYLMPLPETGIRFYGQGGPALAVSPDDDIGLSLVAGADIPMKRRNRYNIEVRFGLGDIPDLKIVLGIVLGR